MASILEYALSHKLRRSFVRLADRAATLTRRRVLRVRPPPFRGVARGAARRLLPGLRLSIGDNYAHVLDSREREGNPELSRVRATRAVEERWK